MKKQNLKASNTSSLFVSIIFSILIVSVLQIFADLLRSNQYLLILAGFLSSLIFVFALVIAGLLCKSMGWKVNWFFIIFCFIVGNTIAVTIDGIAMTTCSLFSFVELYLLYNLSKKVY
ncbi:keratinocyte-associated protein [Anaeramoeba flamelloides]|uniref:Keratinocyte-associated protein n=1 Tax=Anaeramoeba flamelloides TaxID=1746091 RepID=A0AAV8A0M7_9EUKA|nr:keratinocyte-associated protein [Anaeramoeba flamelloides]|eukprot:Anaeramoba_flamelloidesa1056734_27.p1 GENE.a1056734_27~~a1056734_27.p1  ORF type:complete len:118 (+),score=9.14 a1056734_27:39-392(+)